jgi:hypothetical protein
LPRSFRRQRRFGRFRPNQQRLDGEVPSIDPPPTLARTREQFRDRLQELTPAVSPELQAA